MRKGWEEDAVSLFSERMGLKPVKSVLQVDSMDEDLRVGLWNAIFVNIQHTKPSEYFGDALWLDEELHTLCRRIWRDYFKNLLDAMEPDWSSFRPAIQKYFLDCEWYEAYDFVEFVAKNHPDKSGAVPEFIDSCNEVLKKELSAYRFVGCGIAPITSEEEIAEIEEALSLPDALSPVKTHLKDALGKLADRESPDYRNSIKESISAVEALCRLITHDPKATLGKALKHIDDIVALHGALQKAFSSLYGYSSDADGIRHALLDEPTLDQEDARFMLVSCSAFINYLVQKASKAGIEW